MSNKFDNFYQTLSDTVESVVAQAADKRAVLVNPEYIQQDLGSTHLGYSEKRRASFDLVSLKGKGTRSRLHVVIERLDNGIYELIVYVG